MRREPGFIQQPKMVNTSVSKGHVALRSQYTQAHLTTNVIHIWVVWWLQNFPGKQESSINENITNCKIGWRELTINLVFSFEKFTWHSCHLGMELRTPTYFK